MIKRILYFCATFIMVFTGWTHFAMAGFEITEIMYDLEGTDTNREWIEVKNTGTDAADLSKWFFFSDNTKHTLAAQGSASVPPGGYAIIAQSASHFRTDWPNFAGLLFDSSWTGFSNEEGETIGLKDTNLALVSSVTFTNTLGASGDGNSLQKLNSSWVAGMPTPGADNQGGSEVGDENNETATSGGTTTKKKKEIEIPKIITDIIIKNQTVFAKIPLEIDSVTRGYEGETLRMGRFAWNFGDGTIKTEAEHNLFEHVYEYPGEYVVTLSYYRAWTGNIIEATDRITVKVIPLGIAISAIGTDIDPYVEIENTSTFEVDFSRWILQGIANSFTVPEGTIILPNQKLRFSGKATGLSILDVKSILLENTDKQVVASYRSTYNPTSSGSSLFKGGPTSLNVKKAEAASTIDLNVLGASASGSQREDINGPLLAWGGVTGVIILGLVSVVLMRRKNANDKAEKGIHESDITIVE